MNDPVTRVVTFSFFFFATLAFSLLANSILFRFVRTLGTKNQPGAVVRWSSETKPAIGGLTFFIIFLFSLLFYFFFFDKPIFTETSEILGLSIGCTLAFVMGLADDAYNTRPVLKFIVQVICGVCLFVTGSSISLFESATANAVLTVLWTVGIMNSINLLDNMDAVASVVATAILSYAIVYLAIHGRAEQMEFTLMLGVLASQFGFLFYNWYPSKIYMGDTGSQFLGVILAFAGIHYGWNSVGSGLNEIPLRQVLIACVIFILPLSDTAVVIISRILRGSSPFVGGRDHTTHSLSYLGLRDDQVAVVFATIGIASLLISVYVNNFAQSWNAWHMGILTTYVLAVFGILFAITYRYKHEH